MYLALYHPSDILDLSAEQLRHAADKVLADKALGRVTAKDSALSERAAAAAVWVAMKTKTKIGMGMKPKKTTKKTTKKRILPTAKRGVALPFLSILGALGSLIGGAASVAKAINDSKAARQEICDATERMLLKGDIPMKESLESMVKELLRQQKEDRKRYDAILEQQQQQQQLLQQLQQQEVNAVNRRGQGHGRSRAQWYLRRHYRDAPRQDTNDHSQQDGDGQQDGGDGGGRGGGSRDGGSRGGGHYHESSAILNYSKEELIRMKRSSFNYIFNMIRPSLINISNCGRKKISPEKQFLIAIWKMATPDSYRSICEKFNISKATVLKSVRRVTKAVTELAPLFVKWPEGNRSETVINRFPATSGFPGIIGAIDGTHINIRAPHINPESYVNRKGHHSIQLQAICDHELLFTHCLAGHVGSVHDQRVFRLSEVSDYLEDETKFSNDSHLVGDAAYTLHEHLMTPFRDNGHLTDRQKNYNFCHSSARIKIEQAFALLKGRFRSLLTVLDMQRTDLIPEFIIACCILHNICLLQNDILIEELNFLENSDIETVTERRNKEGQRKRKTICDNLIIRK
ncbi:PREDICTED: LOW QUALITY PROTEIN: uncharacterized protein LOC108766619 [Trachymyrmex cornetzi]|uniref:LOW QUALITY PROTEIN: uncharacterized protein LOC108766619 n=1 Tax=Trachymyrmex cornetzi TaxID=471704 RepID=UPI00084EF292|nr:PREDICTED: LOW QUALITY PROTEIN: uncharacterized protein LOC108766619 [Trachymyrmex cornetzi]